MIFKHQITDSLSRTTFNMEGILLVNKPSGPTSFQVIKLLRRITGERKIGHTGTLDPDARGLLLVAIGRATKTVRFLQELRKEYVAKILLGVLTETDDISGKVLREDNISQVPYRRLRETLKALQGKIKQVPPRFSAVRYKGKRAYFLARRGEDFSLKEKDIEIYKLDILYYSHPYLKILVECSKGTYIRSLARDIGRMLGSCATLFSLLRRSIGSWTLRDSLSIDETTDRGTIEKNILSVSEVFKDFPQTDLNNPEFAKILSFL